MATAYLFRLIIEMTKADTDQEHIESIIYNCPSIPDRTQYILGKSSMSPLPAMIEAGRKLAQQGVDNIAIPCITAHYFHRELEEAIGVPIIHVISETCVYLCQRNIKKVGVMATDGTVKTGLFSDQLKEKGIACIYPSEKCQSYIMDIIYKNIKAGRQVEPDKFHEVSGELKSLGAEVILLGCTELSMIKRDYAIGQGYLDVMEILAKCCVEKSDATLKKEYHELITV